MKIPATLHQIKTPRLLLRKVRTEDAPLLFEHAKDPDISYYMTWPLPKTFDPINNFIVNQALPGWESGQELTWAITEAGDDAPIGLCSTRFPSEYIADIGYWLAKPWWGKGIMTEAVKAMVASIVDSMPHIYRVSAIYDIDNPASGRVMEKAGLQREGIQRRRVVHPNISPEPRDCVAHAWAREVG